MADAPTVHPDLALFPLQTVLFPGGLLVLKVFETRYVDMVAACLRERRPFGVVALRAGSEVRRPGSGEEVALQGTGTLAELIDVDSAQTGILQIRCRGTRRFRLGPAHQQPDGLWRADATEWPDDPVVAPLEPQASAVTGLRQVIDALQEQGELPFLQPLRFESAGWVANRWCEILPIAVEDRQLLLEMVDPVGRLAVVDSVLRSQAATNA
ncbi:LON peptidase substrate-binding domain-containing protein [Piscinibacter koreensis]|uniref:LON peptidase substrate-binding domain-containing protein n=1 Tax=Piscinibacter koreensis TaxID=2742824 RepID=A0A7Y6NNW8_9BURK|nr:LON peptidase substrate-binding domain-containing protein [Schlegelella koreensis]NUZ06673.1 LON peptidase substrate-binding domain-containing protein [Schlegelella koreensis]